MGNDEIDSTEERVNPNVLMATLLDEVNTQLSDIHKTLVKIKDLQIDPSQSPEKQQLIKFNTSGTLTNAITTQPDPLNIDPTTGYSLVKVWENLVPNRIVKLLYFLNLGPGTVNVLIAHSTLQFEEQEVPVYAGNVVRLENVFALLVRTNLANTQFFATEYDIGSWTLYTQFDDREGLAAHLRVPFTTAGPHGTITRASYTVPTGFKAKVTGVYEFMYINTPAVSPKRRNITVGITNPTIGGISLMSRTFGDNENDSGLVKEAELGFSYTLLEGEVINITTFDVSTGGIVNYFSSVAITQYFPIPS